MYAFTIDALFLLIITTFLILALFLKFVECPMIDLNPFHMYTPSLENPRQAFIPILQSSATLGFDILTLFYPPAFKSEFNNTEQEYINQGIDESMFDFRDNIDIVNRGVNENLLN